MAIYDQNSFTVVPEASGFQDTARGVVPQGVPVIYVSVDEPEPRPRRSVRGPAALKAAARALHRMADRVDTVRRNLERAADGAHS